MLERTWQFIYEENCNLKIEKVATVSEWSQNLNVQENMKSLIKILIYKSFSWRPTFQIINGTEIWKIAHKIRKKTNIISIEFSELSYWK